MPLLLPPPRDPSIPSASGERLRGLEYASGPSPYEYNRNRAFGPPRGLCPSHTARCEPLVCHRVYNPEVALRQRMSAKYIHTFRRIGSSLPAATSRASRASLPMHVRPRTYAVSLPTTSHVPLYNHMYSSETACVDRIRLLFSSPSRAQRRPQRPTTMRTALSLPRVWSRDRVPRQNPYLFDAHCSHRRPSHGSLRPLTPPMREPATPCRMRKP